MFYYILLLCTIYINKINNVLLLLLLCIYIVIIIIIIIIITIIVVFVCVCERERERERDRKRLIKEIKLLNIPTNKQKIEQFLL